MTSGKDMPEEWIPKRGTQYGCGMGLIPLGDGVVGIEAIVKELLRAGKDIYVEAIQSGGDVVWDPAAYRITSPEALNARMKSDIRGDWMDG